MPCQYICIKHKVTYNICVGELCGGGGVFVICVFVFTVFLYCFVYVYLFLFVLSVLV